MPRSYVSWHHGVRTLQCFTAVILLLAAEAAAEDIASEVVGPVAFDKAQDLLPVSKASFQELKATNAALRASDASLKQSNSDQVATLEAAEAKIKELSPGTSGTDGINALDGPRGPNGPTGALGQSSVTGGVGFSGVAGGSGFSGSNGFSPTGQTGLTRDGTRGYSGATGQNGKQAQSGATGALGTFGNTGSKGPSGLLGLSGTTGATSVTNVQGGQGSQGFVNNGGMTGGNGALGTSGASGTSGLTGASGLSGESGNSGLTGASVSCATPYVTLNFDDLGVQGFLALPRPYTYRGLTITNLGTEAFVLINSQSFTGVYPAHSLPTYFYATGGIASAAITLMDSSGATFGLQSFYIGADPFGPCDELVTITGSTNGGVPNPACTVQPFIIRGGSNPVQVTFGSPQKACFATSITVQVMRSPITCAGGNALSLDDITVCPTTTTSSIA